MTDQPPASDPPPPPVLPRTRADLVRDAATTWANQLIDVGGRNNLLFYRDLRAGTLDLTAIDPLAIESLLAGRTVRLSNLFLVEPGRKDALNRARTIHAKARENFEERGVTTMYIALGLATWTAVRGTATPSAPILLRPAELRPRGAAQDDFDLQAAGEMEVNPLLLHALRTDFGRPIDGETLLAQLDGPIDTRAEVQATYDWLHVQADGVRGFSMTDRTIAGNFLYAKLPMVRDIESSHATIAAHDLLSAVAGDATARESLRRRDDAAAAVVTMPDATPPGDEFLVLDADASQHEAVNRILAGQDLIIKGPPGTGKSQTIANLIATLLAHGQKVLFVAEKRAAIDAVFKRLDRVGLADMILDIHGGVKSRRALADELARSLAAASQVPPVDVTALSNELLALRTRLNDTAHALHAPRDPWSVTVYGARARLDALPPAAATAHRFRGDQIRGLGGTAFADIMANLRTYLELDGFRLHRSPWAFAPIDSPDAGLAALDDVRAIHDQLPALRSFYAAAAAETTTPEPTTAAERSAVLDRWMRAQSAAAAFTDTVWSADLERLVADMAPAGGGAVGRLAAGLLSGGYRAARTAVQAILRAPLSDENAYTMLVAARDLRNAWPANAGLPRPPAGLAALAEQSQVFDATLVRVAAATGRPELASSEFGVLEQAVTELLRDGDVVRKLPDARRLDRELQAAGLVALMDEMRAAGLSDGDVLARVEHAWLRSILDEVEFRDPLLATFDAGTHAATIARFREVDRRHLAMNATRLMRIYAEHAVKARDQNPDEAAIVKGQANRKRGHLPLRTLFQKAPNWIDLAVHDTVTPERYVLAVETDGPLYGWARTARDRDRLRQEQLERLGWAFQRAWSREWETAPDVAMRRLVGAAQPPAPPVATAIPHGPSGAGDVAASSTSSGGGSAAAAVAGSAASAARAASIGSSSPASATSPAAAGSASSSGSSASGQPMPVTPPPRGPRPRIPHYGSITDYTQQALVDVLTWLESDGLLRTEEDVIDEAVRVLGFMRHGPRIDAALSQALKVSRARRGR